MNERRANPGSAVVAPPATVLAVGATGSVGRLVGAEALEQGYKLRALVRNPDKAGGVLPSQADLVGIRGNTHFASSDLNNLEIADLLSKFLESKGLAK